MSVARVLKNVFTFTQVLGQASSEEVAHWDTPALTNALRWSEYCQQVYRHVKGKQFESDFEEHLWEMGLLLEPPMCVFVDLSLLQNATQVLQNVLLHNPHLNTDVLNSLVSNISGDDSSRDALIQRVVELGSLHGAVRVADSLLQDVSLSVGDSKSDLCATVNPAYSQAAVLIEHLVGQLGNTSKLHRFTQYVEKLAEALVEQKNGWEILLCTLCVESSNLEEKCQLDQQKTRDVIYQWIEKSVKTTSHQRTFCEVNSSLLAMVAAEDTRLFQLYLNVLLDWGERMVPDYTRQTESAKLYIWRPRKDSSIGTFSSLVNHFVSLLGDSHAQAVRKPAVSFLTDRAAKSYFNIWRDVIKSVHKTLPAKKLK